MNSAKKNFIYNVIYQILILIIPFITAPYLARVVGVDGVGTYSYTYSIVYYFMLLTLLGVNNYGNRTIAKVRDNKEELSKNFWGIYIFQLILGILMLIIYLLYIFIFDIEYRNISLIQSLFIISSILDINWLFFGLEEFKKTITRNVIVKLGNVILIFILVKSTNDLWKYTLIMSGMTCIGQLLLWGFIKNKISFVKLKMSDITKHIKPNLVLFIPVIAVSLYKMMDKVMLGSLTTVGEVGFYENAEKIVSIPLTVITALGTVMLPRISNIMARGQDKEVEKYINKSIHFVMFLSYAMCFGLIGIGYHFAPLYFGSAFQKTGLLIMLLALTLPFVSFANVIRAQYLIPKEMDKTYIISTMLGALINLILNFIFIPQLGGVGACIGTIAAEAMVMIYQAIAIRSYLPISKYVYQTFPFFIKALIMFACIFWLNFIQMNSVLRLIIQIVLGVCIYSLLNLKYILSEINIQMLLDKIKQKRHNVIVADIDNDGTEDVLFKD